MKKFIKIKVLSRVAGIAGALLLVSTILELLNLSFMPENLSSYINTRLWLPLLTGLLFSILWLLTARGFKGFYFYLTVLIGLVLILIPLLISMGTIGEYIRGLFRNDGFTISAGFILLLLSRWMSKQTIINTRRFSIRVIVVVIGSLAIVNLVADTSFESVITYQGELNNITKMLHPSYLKFEEEIEDYITELLDNDSLSKAEKDQLINDLNSRIKTMEDEAALFEEVKRLNRKYLDEIAMLKEKVGDTVVCPGALSEERVSSFNEAVRRDSPCVRDFAVSLASSSPGSYYRGGSDASPGRTGIEQIIAVHRYISGEWKYVNDPLFAGSDYYSPADRTLAVGLAGDCDDFAILLASSIEAIGGRARIVGGDCNEGAHAWSEVYIGSSDAWKDTVSILKKSYPGISINYIDGGSAAGYWLSLDWQIASYSCGNNPVLLYESGKGAI
ncbi:MAG: transglutaminase-like domain-containing protein [Spirochaetia bacterium]|nr:transglutaminase-like domain-containing protein [Spirochaetia bacterium]